MTGSRVVIVGGGLAAVRTAQTLRDIGHDGEIVMLSAEAEQPYDRPPLSKDHLLGQLADDGIRLLPESSYDELRIELRLDSRVQAIDPSEHTVTTADGGTVAYDRLVVATGAHARTLPVLANTAGALALRSADDSRRLAGVLERGGNVAVVGGGFIGLEVAATARSRGCEVTVVEAQAAPLVGAVGPEIATWLQARHLEQGVRFRCGTTVLSAEDTPAGGTRLTLADGTLVEADAVVVGVGVARDVGWLSAAGIEVAEGLVCDEDGRTSDPDVFGAGDVVCHRGGAGAIGHWTAAGISARRAAHAIVGKDAPTAPDDGFFWSDQYGLRLQFAGRLGQGAEFTVTSGALDDGSFVGRYSVGNTPTAVVAVNDPRGFLRGRVALRSASQSATVTA